MTEVMTVLSLWAFAALANATPLIFVTLGETLTQRTGIINLGVEGGMLAGACTGFAVAATTGNPWFGLLAGIAAGMSMSAIHAALVLGAGANQLASGIAVWMFALGVTSYAGRAFVGGRVEPLPSLAESGVASLPILGAGLAQLSLAAPLAILAIVAATLWLERTRTGLGWRVAGESAEVSAANGMSPVRARVAAILTGGCLAGFGGAVLSIDYTQTWAEEITKGRGLIAVGLVIVARWKPAYVLPVCLLFGLAETAALRLPAMGVEVSSYLLSSLPYVAVIAVLIVNHAFRPVSAEMPADLRKVFQ